MAAATSPLGPRVEAGLQDGLRLLCASDRPLADVVGGARSRRADEVVLCSLRRHSDVWLGNGRRDVAWRMSLENRDGLWNNGWVLVNEMKHLLLLGRLCVFERAGAEAVADRRATEREEMRNFVAAAHGGHECRFGPDGIPILVHAGPSRNDLAAP